MSCLRKKVNSDTHVSLAHAHGYLKISRNPLLRVYRDVLLQDETTHDSEINLSVEPRTSCDQATDEHDVISGTRKRRRLTHKSLSLHVLLMILKRKMPCWFTQIVLCPPLPNFLMRSDLLLEQIGATGFEGDLFSVTMSTW